MQPIDFRTRAYKPAGQAQRGRVTEAVEETLLMSGLLGCLGGLLVSSRDSVREKLGLPPEEILVLEPE